LRKRNPTLFFHHSTFTTEYLYNGDGICIAQIEDGWFGRMKACLESLLRQDKLRRRAEGGRAALSAAEGVKCLFFILHSL
jgi:hypothetical protein